MNLSKFELDHIGIAVETLEQGFKFYQALGFKEMEVEEVPSQKVKTGFLRFANQATLELLEPTSSDSTLRKFLDKHGPGVHHFCLRVQGLDRILIELKAKGVRLIDEQAKIGAHGCRVAFIHPASTGGVLIELSEKTGEHV
jgi:methylmalonyl-CoA/ethylmalonyl-CoA epimerase